MKNVVQFELTTVNQSKNVQRPAVLVRRAFKQYDSGGKVVNVLNNLNMTVAKGAIYGLLGYMESGKTTLLSCLVGSRLLNSGKVWVLGNDLSTVRPDKLNTHLGYMPKQISLHKELSIKETMLYFGWIHGIKIVQIQKQLLFMLNALDLPNQNCVIGNLSRSQQRRVSFAVTLLHDPELLILDEPMTEMDLLLRQCLWHYLKRSIKNSQKTIIFSARNFDDARHANTVGILYDGRICVEDSPQALLTKFSCASLEQIVTNLSNEETNSQLPDNDSTFNVNKVNEPPMTNLPADDNGESRRDKISTLLKKDFLRLRKNWTTVILIYTASIIQIILFCLTVGRDPTGLKLAVVNDEMNFTTKECPITKGCTFKYLSCRYLALLNEETVDINYYPDFETALNAVRAGTVWGVLHFEKNFTDVFIASRIPGLITDEEIFNDQEIKVWLDQSNQPNALELSRRLQQALRDFSQDLWSSCKRLNFQKSPINFKKSIKDFDYFASQQQYSPENVVAIVNFETNQTSSKCTESQVCSFEKLSCHYLPYLYQQLEENNLKWNNDSLDIALKLLEEGNIIAVLYISYNFTSSIATKWLQGHSFEEVISENPSPEISLLYYVNDSVQEHGMSLKYSYNNFLRHLWDSCKNDTKAPNIVNHSTNDYAVNSIRKNKIININESKLAIINGYVNSTDAKCSVKEECSLKTLNCQFVAYLKNTTAITVEEYNNVHEALFALWKREVSAIVFVYIKKKINKQSTFWLYSLSQFSQGTLNVKYGYNIWLDTFSEQEMTGVWIQEFITNQFYPFFNIFINNCHKLLDVLNPPIQNNTYYNNHGTPRTRKVLAIVNDDWSFINEDCPAENGCTFSYLSCRYLRYIKPAFRIRKYSDVSSAKQTSRRTDVGGVLYIKKNFTAALVKRWFLGSTDKETLHQSIMEYWDDVNYEFRIDYGECSGWGTATEEERTSSLWHKWIHTNYRCFVNDAYQVLRVAYGMFLDDIWESCRNTTKVIDPPIKFESTFDTDDSFADFVTPGFILIFIHFLAAALMRTEIIIEESEGIFERSLIAGLPAGAILLALVILHSVIMCGQAAIMFIIFLAFGITCRGSISSAFALTLLQGLCGICFGLAVAIVFKTGRTSSLSIVVCLSLTLIVGGVIWPIEGMPLMLNYMSRCLPLTQAIASLRAILTKGTVITDPDVYLGFMATITWMIFFIITCETVLKFSRSRWKKTILKKWI